MIKPQMMKLLGSALRQKNSASILYADTAFVSPNLNQSVFYQ